MIGQNISTLFNSQPFPSYNNSAADDFEHFCQKIENLYNWMDKVWLKVENIVGKGEIADLLYVRKD